MKREKAPLGKYVEIFWPAIAAYAACTALVFLALYYLLCRYSGLEGGRVLFGGWIILVAIMGVFSHRMLSRRNVQEKLTQSALERTNQHMREIQLQKRKEQLNALQNQINPHFLYNTLDTISWLARAHDAMDVVQLVDALTNMFRVGLSSGHDYIPLREEKRHVVNYLYIQGVRYGERLKYEIEIPEAYENIIVPKLILQPLVENAIYHGIKLKRTGGTIRVSSRADEERLYLSVRDNGAGISAERLADIRVWLADPKSRERQVGFGLSYMEERIELSYGSGYGLSIDSREGEFTEVVICLPVQGGERNV